MFILRRLPQLSVEYFETYSAVYDGQDQEYLRISHEHVGLSLSQS